MQKIWEKAKGNLADKASDETSINSSYKNVSRTNG